MNSITSKKINLLLPLFLSICIFTPLTNDIFIPALPLMEKEFLSASIRYLIPIFMLGSSLGQLAAGPLLDRFGRKPILIWGLFIFSLATAVISFTNSLSIILLCRFIQALGCSVTIPGVMAIIRDSFAHERLVHVISRVMGFVVITPVLAPLLGSYLTLFFSWRANFILLLFLGGCYLLLYIVFFKETSQAIDRPKLTINTLVKNYIMLLTDSGYMKFVLCAAFSYGVIFSYIIAAPFLLIKTLHVPLELFGWYFALFAIILAIISFLIPTFIKRYTLNELMITGTVILVAGAIILLVSNIILKESLVSILVPMSIISLGLAFVRTCSATLAMQVFPKTYAGISSSTFNFVSYMMGVISTSILSHISITAIHFSIQILILSVISLMFGILSISRSDPSLSGQ